MSERNPISIDAGRKTKKSQGTTTKSSTTKRDKTPAPAKRAGTRRSSASHSAGKAKTSTSTKSKASNRQSNPKKTAAEPENHATSTPVPPRLPQNLHPGLHDRSYAAHLDAGPREPHTKPAGDLRFLAPFPTGRKQP